MSQNSTPAQLVEAALAAVDGQAVVIVEHESTADLRWARSTLTTNGERNGLSLTVIAFAERADGVGTATLSATGPDLAAAADLAKRASAAAVSAPSASDAMPLVAGVAAIPDDSYLPLCKLSRLSTVVTVFKSTTSLWTHWAGKTRSTSRTARCAADQITLQSL